VPALVVAGAAAIAGGALARWWSVRWSHPMLGEQTSTFTGRQAAPALLVTALVAVAGLGAVAAARGALRRVIGLLVAAAGALAVVAVWSGIGSVPADRVTEANPQVQRIVSGDRSWFGPVVSGFGGLLVLVGGLLVLAGLFAGRGMGSRFDRSGPTRAQSGADGIPGPAGPPDPDGATGAAGDDEARSLWTALDAGDDPTEGEQQSR
jgi:hypothetical protein